MQRQNRPSTIAPLIRPTPPVSSISSTRRMRRALCPSTSSGTPASRRPRDSWYSKKRLLRPRILRCLRVLDPNHVHAVTLSCPHLERLALPRTRKQRHRYKRKVV